MDISTKNAMGVLPENSLFNNGSVVDKTVSLPKTENYNAPSEKEIKTDKILVFVVDDDKAVTHALKHSILTTLNKRVEVKTFATGEECMLNINQQPMITILDYYLDSHRHDAMNGMKVLKKIKQLSPQTQVIMLSGQSSIDVALNSIKYKAFDYVTKNEEAFQKISDLIQKIIQCIDTDRDVRKDLWNYRLVNIGILVFLMLFFFLLRFLT